MKKSFITLESGLLDLHSKFRHYLDYIEFLVSMELSTQSVEHKKARNFMYIRIMRKDVFSAD